MDPVANLTRALAAGEGALSTASTLPAESAASHLADALHAVILLVTPVRDALEDEALPNFAY